MIHSRHRLQLIKYQINYSFQQRQQPADVFHWRSDTCGNIFVPIYISLYEYNPVCPWLNILQYIWFMFILVFWPVATILLQNTMWNNYLSEVNRYVVDVESIRNNRIISVLTVYWSAKYCTINVHIYVNSKLNASSVDVFRFLCENYVNWRHISQFCIWYTPHTWLRKVIKQAFKIPT